MHRINELPITFLTTTFRICSMDRVAARGVAFQVVSHNQIWGATCLGTGPLATYGADSKARIGSISQTELHFGSRGMGCSFPVRPGPSPRDKSRFAAVNGRRPHLPVLGASIGSVGYGTPSGAIRGGCAMACGSWSCVRLPTVRKWIRRDRYGDCHLRIFSGVGEGRH